MPLQLIEILLYNLSYSVLLFYVLIWLIDSARFWSGIYSPHSFFINLGLKFLITITKRHFKFLKLNYIKFLHEFLGAA